MSGQMPMRKLWRFGHRVGICSAWYAAPNRGFLNPGIYIWMFNKNVRIIPMWNRSKKC